MIEAYGLAKNFKNTTNHRGPYENLKIIFIPDIKMYTCFQHKNERESNALEVQSVAD